MFLVKFIDTNKLSTTPHEIIQFHGVIFLSKLYMRAARRCFEGFLHLFLVLFFYFSEAPAHTQGSFPQPRHTPTLWIYVSSFWLCITSEMFLRPCTYKNALSFALVRNKYNMLKWLGYALVQVLFYIWRKFNDFILYASDCLIFGYFVILLFPGAPTCTILINYS